MLPGSLAFALLAALAAAPGGTSPAAAADASAPAPSDASVPAPTDASAPAPTDASAPAPTVEPAPPPSRGFGLDPRARAERRRRWLSEGESARRKFMIGIAGVLLQAPTPRIRVVPLDPRDIGRTVAMGGLGLFGRYRPRPLVGLDVEVSSGSIRYGRKDLDVSVSQDQLVAEVGTLLYLGRGDVFQVAVSGGIGGMASLLRYDQGERSGRQRFGSVTVRLGAEAEVLLKRIAIVLSFRSYGVGTARDRVHTRGALLQGQSEADRRAPVPKFMTMLMGSIGIAYRF